jgi:hypothetical protein
MIRQFTFSLLQYLQEKALVVVACLSFIDASVSLVAPSTEICLADLKLQQTSVHF